MNSMNLRILILPLLVVLAGCDPIYRKHFPVSEIPKTSSEKSFLSLSGKDYNRVYQVAVLIAVKRGMILDEKESCLDEQKARALCDSDVYTKRTKTGLFILSLTKKDRPEKGLRVVLSDWPSFQQSEESKYFEKEMLDSLSAN
jgi:hypothetical protein